MHVLDVIGRSLADERRHVLADPVGAGSRLCAFRRGSGVRVPREMRRALGDYRPVRPREGVAFRGDQFVVLLRRLGPGEVPVFAGRRFHLVIVFMVASTNLVVELGIVLWLLIGWQFALAEFVGGAIMITLLGSCCPRAIPRGSRCPRQLDRATLMEQPHDEQSETEAWRRDPRRVTFRRPGGWADASGSRRRPDRLAQRAGHRSFW